MRGARRNALRNAVVMALFALAGTALLAGTYQGAHRIIAQNQEAEELKLLDQVMPARLYDNNLVESRIALPPDPLLGSKQPASAWIARRHGQTVGVVLSFVAPNGYGGPIGLLMGVDAKGRVLGVRVTESHETPGLGDYIEKSHGDWIDQFQGKSLADPAGPLWRVRKDGGIFTYVTGATITPRAVVAAVHHALQYVALHRRELYAPAQNQGRS